MAELDTEDREKLADRVRVRHQEGDRPWEDREGGETAGYQGRQERQRGQEPEDRGAKDLGPGEDDRVDSQEGKALAPYLRPFSP